MCMGLKEQGCLPTPGRLQRTGLVSPLGSGYEVSPKGLVWKTQSTAARSIHPEVVGPQGLWAYQSGNPLMDSVWCFLLGSEETPRGEPWLEEVVLGPLPISVFPLPPFLFLFFISLCSWLLFHCCVYFTSPQAQSNGAKTGMNTIKG